MDEFVVLYRPVGQTEFGLIQQAGFREFPSRLPEQPFFYPVVNEEYAIQIARDWNTQDPNSGFAGYVLRFKLRADFIRKYPTRQVGDRQHCEYWIPAGDLPELNRSLIGKIEIIRAYHRKATS